MYINRQVHKLNVNAPKIPEGNYLKDRIGFWALVTEQNSLNNTVTVVSDTGYELKNIPVKSDEWVTIDQNKDYIPSQRNLPPVNSRVFVLTPTYSAMGAFILCSGFSRGDENIRTLWAQNDNELEDKNNCRETKTQGGWDIQEEYSNGNYSVKSKDNKIQFTANTTENNQKSQVKEVSLIAWGNKIVINEDGITVVDDKNNNKKNEIVFNANGITVTDVNNNTIVTSDKGIKVTDTENKKIELSHSSTADVIKISDDGTEVINYNHPAIGETKLTLLGHLEVTQ